MNTTPNSSTRLSRRLWLAIWLVASLVLGIGASFIPWGSPSTFHGIGFPIFVVAWERSPSSGHWLDYPNPLGYILNPLLIFVAGICAWLLFRAVVTFRRRHSSFIAPA